MVEASNRRKYEVVVIMHPDATEEEQKTLFRKNRDIIQSFKGEVHHLDTWGKRRLANPIGKFNRGVYFHSTFESDGQAIHELERTMRINERVLRFTHTRLDDRISLPKYVEQFKTALADAIAREKERESKILARKQATQHPRRDGPSRPGGREKFDRFDQDSEEHDE